MLLSKEFVFTFGSKNQELSSCDNDTIKIISLFITYFTIYRLNYIFFSTIHEFYYTISVNFYLYL